MEALGLVPVIMLKSTKKHLFLIKQSQSLNKKKKRF